MRHAVLTSASRVLSLLAVWFVLASTNAQAGGPVNRLIHLLPDHPLQFEWLAETPAAEADGVQTDEQDTILFRRHEMLTKGGAWETGDPEGLNRGFSTDRYWLRFQLLNDTSQVQTGYIELPYPQLDFVDFHIQRSGQWYTLSTGDQRPYGSREIHQPGFLKQVRLAPGETADVLIALQTTGSLFTEVLYWSPEAYIEHASQSHKVQFYYFGVLTVTILVALTFFFVLRSSAYIFYCIATLGYMLYFAGLRGYSYEHLWPNSPELNSRMFLMSLPLLAVFTLLFARRFIRTAHYTPRLNRFLDLMIGLELINLLISAVAEYSTAIRISAFLALPMFIVLILVGPFAWWAGSRAARYFTLAWSMLSAGIIVTALHSSGFLPNAPWAIYGMQAGSAAEAILLTLGLAMRVYQERSDKIRAQAQLIDEVQSKQEMEQRLTHAALHDQVTGLPNRAQVERRLEELQMQDPAFKIFIGIMRLRGYKDIAITLGQANADDLIRAVAQDLDERSRSLPGILPVETVPGRVYSVGQLGASSFVLLADGVTARAHEQQFVAFLNETGAVRTHAGFRLEILPVLGISIVSAGHADQSHGIRNALIAAEQAERSGLRFAFYDGDDSNYSEHRLTLMTELRRALREDETALWYQPKIHAATGRVEGLEALIRWESRHSGWINPDEFIPVAERSDLIDELTKWVVARGLSDLKILRDEGHDLSLSVNLSARNLGAESLTEEVRTALRSNQLDPHLITLELTETAMMQEPEGGLLRLQAFRSAGLSVAIDDFGAGYSSLSYLKRLPVNEIKIDKTLLTDILTAENSRLILQTTIEMCQKLGYRVVAEGVETEAEAQLLRQMSCDSLQGYHFSRPLPLEKLRVWLSARAS